MGLITEEVELTGVRLLVADQGRLFSDETAPFPDELGKGFAFWGDATEGVEDGELPSGLEK